MLREIHGFASPNIRTETYVSAPSNMPKDGPVKIYVEAIFSQFFFPAQTPKL